MKIRILSSSALLLFAIVAPASAKDDSESDKRRYREGTIRAGAFFITRITTTLAVSSNTLPLGHAWTRPKISAWRTPRQSEG